MRETLALLVAFTIGASAAGIHYEREIGDLKRDAEHAYHEGFLDNDAWRDAAEIERENAQWNCATMGNRKCGPTE